MIKKIRSGKFNCLPGVTIPGDRNRLNVTLKKLNIMKKINRLMSIVTKCAIVFAIIFLAFQIARIFM